jgi:uncharacterized membrane protein YgcG
MDNAETPDYTPTQGGCRYSSRPDQAAIPRQKKSIAMKTNFRTPAAILAAAILCAGAFAQTAGGSQTPAPNVVIYLPQIPTAADLASGAAARGLTVVSIQQTAGEEIATYRLPNGQTNIVAYQALPAAGSAVTAAAPAPVAAAGQATVVTPSTPAPAVVYEAAAPDYAYSYPYDYYYPWGWYGGPYYGYGYGYGVGIGFRGGWGFGGGGFRGGGFHGGFHGGSFHGGGGHR